MPDEVGRQKPSAMFALIDSLLGNDEPDIEQFVKDNPQYAAFYGF